MLTDNQKKIIRILINRNPNPDYMVQLGASDDFALSEISSKKAGIITEKTNRITALSSLVALEQADLVILQEEG